MAKDDEVSSSDVTQISKLDFGDPLYLHPSDISSTPLINVKLKATKNYKSWACAIELALQTKNKMDFINGTFKRNEGNEVLEIQWDRCNVVVLSWRCNVVVLSWILGSMSEELYNGQIYSKIVSEVWTELKETYDKVDGSVIFNLYQKINSITQNGSVVSDYYHKLNSLWKQYDIMIQLPSCEFTSSKAFKDHTSLIKLMQFLVGLDDVYQPIRSNILTRDPLPSVNTAFSIISREESHRGTHSIEKKSSSETSAVFANTYKDKSTQNHIELKCIKCGRNNHTMFEVIAYPPNFMKKGFGNNNFKRNNSKSSNENQYPSTSTNVSLSHDQITRLLSLLDDKSGSRAAAASAAGANQHMTNSIKNFDSYTDVSDLNITVGHPNGTKAKVSKIGCLKLSGDIVLQDVLDLVSRETLLTGSQNCGLYLLTENKEGNINSSNISNTSSSSELWHCRLGHPADQALNALKLGLTVKQNENKLPCEDSYLYKFSQRSEKCVFLGYSSVKKGYKLYGLESKSLFISRDVKFYENIFPFKLKSNEFVNPNSDNSVNQLNFFEVFKMTTKILKVPMMKGNICMTT
ncbi:uncharacterized protein [Rutidosis leptorrhynchoides]|uniref:uncharacterized protein n=1 Tax=Rutidosis leptorrhynchoides TaxID=125765 RepID=UPI003A9903AA